MNFARTAAVFSLACFLLASTAAFAVTYEGSVPGVNGFTSVDKVTWRDSKGLLRELFFARSYPNSRVPQIMGYVTRLTWQPDASSPRIIAAEDPAGINTSIAQGWGTNIMHMHYLQYGGVHPIFGAGLSATSNKRDGFDFVQGPLFLGANHLIFRVTYKQYTTLIRSSSGDDRKFVYVTTDWFIADGLDHVVFAHTLDAAHGYQTDSVAFLNNSLAPYSWISSTPWNGTSDWAGGSGPPDGQSWGDFKTFVTSDMANWTYGGANSVPFVWEWLSPARGRGNAEAAFVQTETYGQKSAGESFAFGRDASGTRMPVYPDLGGQEVAYQLNFFDGYGTKRLTWNTRFGLLYGGGGSTPGYLNYSLAMHLGRHSDLGVPALLAETEQLHNGAIRVQALTGSLRGSGPQGSGNPTTHTFSPPGYNHVYRTWELQSANNAASVSFNAGAGGYRRPVFVLNGFTSEDLNAVAVTLNGAPLSSSSFAASIDAAADRLYVTLLLTLTGDNVILVQGSGGGSPSPVSSVTVSPSTLTVASNGAVSLTAQARDALGNVVPNEAFTWTVPGSVGTISPSGDFTASCAPGTYSGAITARASNGTTGSATVVITPGPPTGLELSPSDAQVTSLASQQYTAILRDACGNTIPGQTITWTSSPAAGAIDSSGLFTASCHRGSYPGAITATAGSLSASAGVNVIGGSLATVAVTPARVNVSAGATRQFAASVTDACGNAVSAPVTWSISGGGSIDDQGLYTAATTASTVERTISAVAAGVTGRAFVTVQAGPVSRVTVTPPTVTVSGGGTTTFTATARDAHDNVVTEPVTWSANTAAGAITQGGVFTASASPGSHPNAVTATVAGVSGRAGVVIQSGPFVQLVLTPTTAELRAGATVTFSATGRDSGGNTVSITPLWSVVAGGGSITSAGVFTAGPAAGSFPGTVRVEASGLTAFASVTVRPGPVRSVSVSPAAVTLEANGSQQFTVEARDAFDNLVSTGFEWEADPEAGTIAQSGLFIASSRAGRYPTGVSARAGTVSGAAAVTLRAPGGGDAGVESPSGEDAGAEPITAQSGKFQGPASGCGCGSVEGALPWLVFGLFAFFRRAGRRRSATPRRAVRPGPPPAARSRTAW